MQIAPFNTRQKGGWNGRWANQTLAPLALPRRRRKRRKRRRRRADSPSPTSSVPAKPRLPANRLRLEYPPAETICHVSDQIKPSETTALPEADGCQTPKEKSKKPSWPVSAPRAYKTSTLFIFETRWYNTACSCAALRARQPSTISIIKRNSVFKSSLWAEALHSPKTPRSSFSVSLILGRH